MRSHQHVVGPWPNISDVPIKRRILDKDAPVQRDHPVKRKADSKVMQQKPSWMPANHQELGEKPGTEPDLQLPQETSLVLELLACSTVKHAFLCLCHAICGTL